MSFLTGINVFQPDLAFFSERRRRFLTEKGAEGEPGLVVEILSPKTAHLDVDQKRVIYARAGVDDRASAGVLLIHSGVFSGWSSGRRCSR